jgi:hypothetical protein
MTLIACGTDVKNTMKIVSLIALLLTTTAHAYTPATDEEKGIWLGAGISLEMRCEMLKHAPFGEAIRVPTTAS